MIEKGARDPAEITAHTPITGSKIFGVVKASFAVSQQCADHPIF